MPSGVLVTIKVMPESPETDLDALKEAIKGAGLGDVRDFKVEPIGFGLSSLKVLIKIEDEGGDQAEKLAESIAAMDGVESAEVEAVSLM